MTTTKAELYLQSHSQLGEGIFWHPTEQKLYWVDITPGLLNSYNPANKQTETMAMGSMIGTAVPLREGGVLAATEEGIFTISPKGKITVLAGFPSGEAEGSRFNDGKCDPAGRFWVGTMHREVRHESGALYQLNGTHLKRVIKGLTISNGMAWDFGRELFYFTDTADWTVRSFDYNHKTGTISNPQVVIRVPQEAGAPDGITIDREGMLWIAHWGGNAVCRWDPQTGSMISRVEVPAPHVTCCSFGGENWDQLFITTAREGLSDEQLENFPLSGSIFTCRPETGGYPTYFFEE